MSVTVLTYGRVTWTNIVRPTAEDIRQLAARYPQFHPLNLQDCLTESEFPKLDQHDDYLFLVVQMPLWDERARISRPAEIDIFVARGTLVTSHTGELKPLGDLFARVQADDSARAEVMGRGASPLLYDLLKAGVDYCFPLSHRIDRDIRRIEERLFGDDTRHILNEIAVIRRELISLRRILRPQLEVVRVLERGSWPFIHEDLDLYWGDIGDHLSQLCSMMDEHIEVVSGLSDTVDTLASHRIDEVVRLLTIVTVLTLPLSLLSTIFSMNVRLPYGQHPLSFFAVAGLGLAITIGLVWYLRRRRWL